MGGPPHEGRKAIELARQELLFYPDRALAYEKPGRPAEKSKSTSYVMNRNNLALLK
jgi:hypothetical protein